MQYLECGSFDEAVDKLASCPVTLYPDNGGFVALSLDSYPSLLVQSSISLSGPRKVISASPHDILVVPIPRTIEEIRQRLAKKPAENPKALVAIE